MKNNRYSFLSACLSISLGKGNRIVPPVDTPEPAVDGDLVTRVELLSTYEASLFRLQDLQHLAVDDTNLPQPDSGDRGVGGGAAPCGKEPVTFEDQVDIVRNGVGFDQYPLPLGEPGAVFLEVLHVEDQDAVHGATADADAAPQVFHRLLVHLEDTDLFPLLWGVVTGLQYIEVRLFR